VAPGRARPSPPLEANATPAPFAERTQVLLILERPVDRAIAAAALHLVGLPVRSARSFHVIFAEPPLHRPLLVIYDQAITARSPLERELLDAFRRQHVPLLAVSEPADAEQTQPSLPRPFTPLDLLGAASAAQPELYDHGSSSTIEPDLEDKLVLLTHDLRRATIRTTTAADGPLIDAALALIEVLKLRDIETALHCYRVQAYARLLAEHLAPACLTDGTTEIGFLLHDIGKLALPDTILQKRGSLTTHERQLMQTHPVIGAEMAARFLHHGHALNVIRSHHERWDGTGYPDRLANTNIPIEARIFAIADALDALTSDRPYRQAATWTAAIETLSAAANSHFDPTVAAALTAQADNLQQIRDQLAHPNPHPAATAPLPLHPARRATNAAKARRSLHAT
jgi:putative nucleotidyltransferase with HDIG domain